MESRRELSIEYSTEESRTVSGVDEFTDSFKTNSSTYISTVSSDTEKYSYFSAGKSIKHVRVKSGIERISSNSYGRRDYIDII